MLQFIKSAGIEEKELAKLNSVADALTKQGKTCWFVCINKQAVCIVAFLDTIRSSATQLISDLKSRG